MEREQAIGVVDKFGRRGVLGEKVADRRTGASYSTVRLENGRTILVQTDLLITREDGTYYVPVDFNELDQQRASATNTSSANMRSGDVGVGEELVVPVIEEQIEVGKREVERGTVRVHKRVREHEELLQETLAHEQIDVERVPLNQVVESATGVRQEGDTVIIPVYEEMVVVEKRLVLKEEVRLHIRRTQEDWTDRVTLRREEVEIERIDRDELGG